MRHPHGLRAAAGIAGGFDPNTPIGTAIEGGFFAGLISHTANGVATHALIVAPRATGATGTGYTLTTLLAWRTVTSLTAAISDYDGAANTTTLTSLGSSPSASFCTGLNIGGFTDWYFPARLEMDIAYFNLKPTTTSNSTSWGTNPYAVPARGSNYTTGNPAQTLVTAFQSGGSEAFVAGRHWTSTDDTGIATRAWTFDFSNGVQFANGKADADRVRAFRRVEL